MAYEVTVSGDAARQAASLPPEGRDAFTSALEQLADDPWSGDPYDTRWSPEFRVITFDGGLATYIVSERRKAVVVEHVIWMG
ncbi:MAG: type II toxin-antitoxin system RelE family toxin [Trebonia sp.]